MHPPSTPPTLPPDRAVYTRLHTDHYPWTEVTVDLAVRQAGGLSGVFEARQGPEWARFVWVAGHLRGGFTAAGDTAWTAMTAALPRAEVTLTELGPTAAELVWTCRGETPEALQGTWPGVRGALERSGFSGVLLGGAASSLWEAGRPVGGPLPPEGAPCHTLTPPGADAASLAAFWAELLALTHRSAPLDEAWRAVCVRLSAEHPCLDPFAREVTVQGGRLRLEPDLPAEEWRPALLAAFRGTLARLGVRLADLPLAELRGQAAWSAAGLEAP
ncbi:hypothetical protein [Deinococcus planocerae]|uniref:hypothetical protein n=1 Tax=Deinococcus planocerae TaxID=1737569 RepID=UPI000C7F0681|nr:hypothetical protein [Deinococcus planocerae]